MPKQFHSGFIEVLGPNSPKQIGKVFRQSGYDRRRHDVDFSKPKRIHHHFRYHRRTGKEVKSVVEKYNQNQKIPELVRDRRILQRRGIIP